MISDENPRNQELIDLINKYPEFQEIDEVFQRMKEALASEIQFTKNELSEKIESLKTVTDAKFDELYNRCNKHVRNAFHQKMKHHEDNLQQSKGTNNQTVAPRFQGKLEDNDNDNDDKVKKNNKSKQDSENEYSTDDMFLDFILQSDYD